MRPAIRGKKKSLRDSESGPDIPVRVCAIENACAAAVRQRGE